jgi:hypothetical protein
MHSAARLNLIGLLALGALFALYGLGLAASDLLLIGLGALALLGYLRDRAGCGALLAPAGLLLGLGLGLTVYDLAHGQPLAWAGATGLFGLGLLGIYGAERRHGWALAFGGLLVVAAAAMAAFLLLPLPLMVGLVLALVAAAVGLNLATRRAVPPAIEAVAVGAAGVEPAPRGNRAA